MPTANTPDDEEDEDDDIVALPFAPPHLRRESNEHDPINVPSDDSEDEDGNVRNGRSERDIPYPPGEGLFNNPAIWRLNNNPADAPFDYQHEEAGPNRTHTLPEKRKKIKTSPPSERKRHARFADSQAREARAGPSNRPPPLEDDGPPTHQILVNRIIDILPDICPQWVLEEVIHAPGTADEGIANIITRALEEGYPKKADTLAKQKQKQREDQLPGHEEMYKGKVYRAAARRGHLYHSKCLEGLSQAFPGIPVSQ